MNELSKNDVKSILCIDASNTFDAYSKYAGSLSKSDFIAQYTSSNELLYKTVIELYGEIVHDIADERSSLELIDFIKAHGLNAAIKALSNVADSFVRGELRTDYWNEHLVYTVLNHVERPESDNVRDLLFLLTYFKKISPACMDLLSNAEIQDLIATNRYNRLNSMSTKFGYWTEHMKYYFNKAVSYARKHDELKEGRFSSGSTLQGSKTLALKLGDMVYSQYCLYDSPLYPLANAKGPKPGEPLKITIPVKERESKVERDAAPDVTPVIFTTYKERKSKVATKADCCRIMAVPKSYKARRIIAPEDTARAFRLQQKRVALEHSICDNYRGNPFFKIFNLKDQRVNQYESQYGSGLNDMVTFDFSHASDLITHDLVWCCTTPANYAWLSELNAKYLFDKTSAKYHTSWIFATAGNPICFNTEGLLFASLALAVYEVYTRFSGEHDLKGPFIYGDDVIVDVRVSDTFRCAASQLGWRLNETKSFSDGPYRESCGAESWKGIDITTKKWPRHEFFAQKDKRQNELEFANCLIEQQHRLYSVSWRAQYYLTKAVKVLVPNMTTSQPNTDSPDLWGSEEMISSERFPRTEKGTMAPECTKRTYGRAIRSVFPKYEESMRIDLQAYEMYLYTQYLIEGPSYADPLMKLLGVSQTRYNLAEACSIPTLKIVEYEK